MTISVGKTLLGFLVFILLGLIIYVGFVFGPVFFGTVQEGLELASVQTEVPTLPPPTQVPTLPPPTQMPTVQPTPTQVPTVQPPATPEQVQVTSCTSLGQNGISCPVLSSSVQSLPVTEGGWTLIAGGNFTLQYGQVYRQFTANETEGNLVYLIGNPGDGTTSSDGNLTATLSGHVSGHVNWTQIYDSDVESPQSSAERQIRIMQTGQGNCGDNGCNTVTVYYVHPDGIIERFEHSR